MGQLFAKHFADRGFDVTIGDINCEAAEKVAEILDISVADEERRCVEEADITLISIPIKETPKVILDTAPLSKGRVLAEIASIKRDTVEALKKAANRGVKPLSIHPLFGPGVRALSGEKIAVIPVLNEEMEVEEAKQIFNECKIFPVDVETHDHSMSLILSLPYLVNLVFASVISEKDIETLRKLAGPNFDLHLLACESALSQNPELYLSILELDRHTEGIMRLLVKNAEELKRMVEEREGLRDLVRQLRERFSKGIEIEESYEKMYMVWKSLRDS